MIKVSFDIYTYHILLLNVFISFYFKQIMEEKKTSKKTISVRITLEQKKIIDSLKISSYESLPSVMERILQKVKK